MPGGEGVPLAPGPIVSILVAYTPAVASASGNVTSLINGAIDATNQTLSNSFVPARVVLAHMVQVTYTETGSHSTALARLQNPSDGYMDNVHALRDQYYADVVILLNDEDDPSSGGQAAGIEVIAAQAFAVVQWDLAIGNYTFAHEIGHLVGGRHHNDTNEDPRRYAHGYVHAPGAWRTVMATVVGNNAIRIPYWSNPDKTFGGVPMGTASYNDNTRVWEERAGTVSDFRTPPPPPPPLSATINGPPFLAFHEKGTYTAIVSGGTGAISYGWYYRLNGTGGWTGPAVTTKSFTITMGTTDVELRCEVTRGTETVNPTTYVAYCPVCRTGDLVGRANVAAGEALLTGIRPNPFNPATTISFTLPEAVQTRVAVFDMLGREVALLADSRLDAGAHEVRFDASDLPSGVYVVRMVAGAHIATERITLMK